MRLHRHEPGDDADERRRRTEAQLGAELAAPGRRAGEGLEIEPERDHDDAIGPPDPARQHIAAHALGDGDERAGPPAEQALRLHHQPRRERREVPVEDVPVVRVHDDGHAAQRGRDPADRAGLRRVGMDDVRAKRTDEPDQRPERRPVTPAADIAPERGQRDHVLRRAAVEREVVPLFVPDPSRDQARLVPLGVQSLCEQHRVERRPADVQAGDDPQHADAPGRSRGGVDVGHGHGGSLSDCRNNLRRGAVAPAAARFFAMAECRSLQIVPIGEERDPFRRATAHPFPRHRDRVRRAETDHAGAGRSRRRRRRPA